MTDNRRKQMTRESSINIVNIGEENYATAQEARILSLSIGVLNYSEHPFTSYEGVRVQDTTDAERANTARLRQVISAVRYITHAPVHLHWNIEADIFYLKVALADDGTTLFRHWTTRGEAREFIVDTMADHRRVSMRMAP